MPDDITPTTVAVAFWRWFWVGAGALALFALVVLGGWQAGWWFTAHNANRQAEVTQNGYSNQTTLRQQVTSQLANVTSLTTQIAEAGKDASTVTALKAQRMAIAGMACQDASEISDTPLPRQQAEWVSANCQDGSVSPQSSIYQAGQP